MLTHPAKRRKKISIISILICFILLLMCFSGCSNDTNNGGLTQDNITSKEEYKEGDSIPEKKINKHIWEKEFTKLTTSSVSIDDKWDEYIVIDGDYVSSKQMVDVSELKNYFVSENGDSGSAENCYALHDAENLLRSIGTSDIDFAQSVLILSSGLIKENAYITNINMQTTINQYEGGFDNLSKYKSTSDKYTIGCTYDKMSALLSNSIKGAEDVQDTLISTTYVCQGKNVKLELCFSKMNDMDDKDAILTGISWTPITIKKAVKDTMYQEMPHWHENNK